MLLSSIVSLISVSLIVFSDCFQTCLIFVFLPPQNSRIFQRLLPSPNLCPNFVCSFSPLCFRGLRNILPNMCSSFFLISPFSMS